MRFLRDDRGQAIQVGAVLIFGILVVFLALYQGFVVPNQNEQVEFDHNQQLQSEMTDLRSDVVSMPGRTTTQSVSVGLGVRYPSRALFVNPGPASGTLRTVGTTDDWVNVTIENATAGGEIGDFWNESRSYNTGALEYRPSYNVFTGAPRTVYEHSVLYNEFGDDATLPVTGQAMVSDDRITLVMLNGSFSENRVRDGAIDFEPISTDTRTVEIFNGTDPVTISMPTRLNGSEWNEALSDEDNVTAVSTEPIPGTDYEMLDITLKNGTYDLQLAKVGVGTGTTGTDPAYLTVVEEPTSTVRPTQNTTITLEPRDEFNVPQRNVVVRASAENGDISRRQRTDSSGRVTFDYRASTAPGEDTLNFTIDSTGPVDDHDPNTATNVTRTVTVQEPSTGGSGGGSAYNVSWQGLNTSDPAITYDAETDVYEYDATETSDLPLTMETDPQADGARVEYSVEDRSVGSLNETEGQTGNDGTDTVLFSPSRTGEVNVYTTSGDDGDRLRLNVTDVPDGILSIDPDQGDVRAVHNWSFEDVAFEGEVDNITASYPSGASFDGLNQDNITVAITRGGESSPTEIEVNDATYSGSSATFDLDGTFNRDIDGPVYVEIDGLENPPEGQDYTATMTFEGDQDTFTAEETFDIGKFDVTIDDVDEEVAAGEQVTVDYTVENTGSRTDTQDIEFTVDGQTEDTTQETLDGGESTSGTFTYQTDSGDTPEVTVEVASANDAASETVSVTEGAAEFDANITGTNSPVVRGENMTFDVTVENVGDAGGAENVTLDISGVSGEQDSQEVSLPAGGSSDIQLVWNTTGADADDYTAEVSTDSGNTDSQTVEVLAPADFSVAVNENASDSEVTEGENATVVADITNGASYEDTQTIEFEVTDGDGNTLDTQSQELTLGSGETDSVTFTYQTQGGDAPSVTTTIRSETDEDSIDVSVLEPSNERLEYDSLVKGDSGVVQFNVQNTGSSAVTITDFAIEAPGISSAVNLDNGDSDEVTISPDSGQDGSANSGPYSIGGTVHPLDTDGIIDGGSAAELDFRLVVNNGGNTRNFDLQQVENESNADVIVTVVFEDGTQTEFYFEDI